MFLQVAVLLWALGPVGRDLPEVVEERSDLSSQIGLEEEQTR